MEGGATSVVNAVLEALSPTGTLIVPAYSMKGSVLATCEDPNYVFDAESSPTNLGSIPEAALQHPGRIRSIHPTHSVVAIGKHAEFVTKDHQRASTTFSTDSPWDRLLQLNGRVLGLGVTVWPVPFCHMLEDVKGASFPLPVRMQDSYDLKCRTPDDGIIEVTVTPLDPEFSAQRIDHRSRADLRDYFWREFQIAEVVSVNTVGQARAWIADARGFYHHLEVLLNEGITIYSTADELARRPLPTSI